MFTPSAYFDLSHTEHAGLFEGITSVWEVLSRIAPYLEKKLRPAMLGSLIGHPFIGQEVYIGEGTVVEPGAYIQGPAWIGKNSVIRHGAYIRSHVIVGNGCTLGNSCEFKNALLFDGAEVPHYNYVGDSILGYKAHLGAGVICSNLKLDRANIHIYHAGHTFDTGLRKMGAIVGDEAEVGCNSVLNPGSILGKKSLIYPLTSWRGVLEENAVARSTAPLKTFQRRF